MKARFLTLWGKLVAAIVSVLGLNGCDIHSVDYGCPYSYFAVKGTVTTADKTPVQGIKVTVEAWGVDENDKWNMGNDTLYTDADGKILSEMSFVYTPDSVSVTIEDVDGEENGGDFQSQTLNPAIRQTREADGEWFKGAFEASFDAALQEKEK